MPIWDPIQEATDQQCMDYITNNAASATASDETSFRNNHNWVQVRELNGHLVGMIMDPNWPRCTTPAGFFNMATAQAFVGNS